MQSASHLPRPARGRDFATLHGRRYHGSAQSLRWLMAIVLVASNLTGCSHLRLPAIDPSGQRICNPLPATTSIAIPHCSDKAACLSHGLKSKLTKPHSCNLFKKPKSAFPEPATPPKCLPHHKGGPAQPKKCEGNLTQEPCVASTPCPGDCKDGPPAVVMGSECNMGDCCSLPSRGKRGCILLSPQKIVAPVGGEVVLLSGICGTDGYLQVAEPLEWMLTPESVGTFIQVGDDDPGFLHTLAGVKKVSKPDPSFAHGVTSTKRMKITRGNTNPRDDVQLEKGQTWITISSPSEGTSKVTVLAPESECWDQRKATSTIYWVDATRQFPGTQIVPAGTPVSLTTRVTRSEGTLPAVGWKVRYEILQPDLASFAGTNGSSFVEATVDEGGNATVQLIPTPGTAGTATVNMQVVRPGGDRDNMPTLTLFSGRTFVTWSAPQLRLRAGAPQIASFGVPFRAIANVSNPGDLPATNVRVTLQTPQGVQVSSTDSFATNVTANAVVWEIAQIPPRTELDLFVDVTTESSLQLSFEGRADGGLVTTDAVTVDVYRPSLVLTMAPQTDRVEVGDQVAFNIDVRNTGDRPVTNLQLAAMGDGAMLHTPTNNRRVVKPMQNPQTGQAMVLQPGQTWSVAVTYIPTDAGRRCISVEATADAGQRATNESCVIAINRPPPTPAVAATLSGRPQISLGSKALYRGVIINTGRIPLDNVKVRMVYDPQLRPLAATEQNLTPSLSGQYVIEWMIPRLEPERSETLEAQFQSIGASRRGSITMTVESRQGARASQRFDFEVLPSSVQQPTTNLPPTMAPPGTPGQPTTSLKPVMDELTDESELKLSLMPPKGDLLRNQPLEIAMRITNGSRRADSNVSLKLTLPEGLDLQGISQRLSPELGRFERKDGVIYLKEIGSLRPGESIDYRIRVVPKKAESLSIIADAVSRGKTTGVRTQMSMDIVESL